MATSVTAIESIPPPPAAEIKIAVKGSTRGSENITRFTRSI